MIYTSNLIVQGQLHGGRIGKIVSFIEFIRGECAVVLNNRVARFGPFTLNTETRELYKSGVRVKLRGQPYLLLEILLAHAAKVVTREQIRLYLWPADTYVDFDRCLNTAVMKLRHALRDSADAPRCIETIPRIGYRFIAALEVSESSLGSMNQRIAALTNDREEIVERFDNLGAFQPQEGSGLQDPTCVSASLTGNGFLQPSQEGSPMVFVGAARSSGRSFTSQSAGSTSWLRISLSHHVVSGSAVRTAWKDRPVPHDTVSRSRRDLVFSPSSAINLVF